MTRVRIEALALVFLALFFVSAFLIVTYRLALSQTAFGWVLVVLFAAGGFGSFGTAIFSGIEQPPSPEDTES